MNKLVFACAWFPCALLARTVEVPTLPTSGFADTESVTNLVIDTSDECLGGFDIRLAANATASNNVQIALGTDVNANGVLEPVETDVVLGWDCGAWFIRDERADWSRRWPEEPGSREFACALRIVRQRARALRVADGDDALLDAAVPDVPGSLFDSGWNLLRVTSRGKALRNEFVALKTTLSGMVLEVR